MTGTLHEFSGGGLLNQTPESGALALPTEAHIVATTLAVAKMRQLSEQLQLVLQYAPRDAAAFHTLLWEASDAWGKAREGYEAYRAILECKGQA